MATVTKTAIVTGGCSGIGLALVRHLLSKPELQWRVVIADIRPEAYNAIASSLDAARHKFIQTDVSSWSSQASLFEEAFQWSGGRLDFLAANAGTVEKYHLLDPGHDDLDGPPVEPSLHCTRVCQFGPTYGLILFVHYARITTRSLKSGAGSADKLEFQPKIVMTSSTSALYPFPVVPEYAAAKSAVLSLVRSIGPNLLTSDNVALNCIMPGYVDTGITPNEVTAHWPEKYMTPTSTTNRAFDELIAEDGRVEQDGRSDGKHGKVKAGKSVEVSVDKLYYRKPVDYPDESQRFTVEQSFHPDGLWMRGVTEQRKKAALAN